MYALERLPVGLVSIYAYINPFIALVLGFLVLGGITGLALITTLSGVWYLNKGYSAAPKIVVKNRER